MDKVYKVDTIISQKLAELYNTLVQEFERNSSIPLSDVNRTLLQTGMVHQLEMMMGLGLIRDEEIRNKLEKLIDEIARDTIHGQGGAFDIKA